MKNTKPVILKSGHRANSRRSGKHAHTVWKCLIAGVVVSLLAACASNEFESGVLVETEPCENNVGPWNGLNDFKIRNDDGSLTVYKCHYKQAVSRSTPCPGLGDPLCEANWNQVNIGSPVAEVRRRLGEPVDVSGIRWQYPNNNSVSIRDGRVVNIFLRSALLYTQQ